ncbi:MAG: response regulator [Bacteroidales bacterium]|nr:response regulator [Bacteroidales bacterium]MCF8456652.1 response regulator [Bacteroidales bacterium]
MKEKPKILIVDDRVENLVALETLLSDFDIELVRALSGAEALAKTFNNQFALAIMDVQMPEMDGYETVTLMRQAKSTSNLPVIFVSAIYKEDFHVIKGIETGAVDFIVKPIISEVLRGKVKVFLELYNYQTSLEFLVRQRTEQLQKEISKHKDTSQKLKIEKEKAEAATHSKSLFLASMSHEIRTPMNGIIGMADILKQTPLNEDQREFLNIINISGNNLMTIINDILDFSKIESGQVMLEHIDFNMYDEVNDIMKLLRLKASEKGLKLTSHIHPSVPEMVIGDPTRIKQVLINLLNNAIKFTDKGYVKLEISVSEKENDRITIIFKIIDTGIGISEQGKKNLFKVFSQADKTVTRKYGGTGLGLAISKNLSILMDGEIGVESDEGSGSTFWFTAKLERAISQKPESNETKSTPGIENKSHLSVLIAEDNPINQKVASYNVERLGHKVDLAENGKEAVEKYQNNKYDLILMDIYMPEMNGVEATKAIRDLEEKNNEKKKIKIVAVTANALKGDREKFLAEQMDGYISKPFKIEDLIEVLHIT